ncbi:leucine-rich repeat protein [uncultured Duncaniella sp.]|uniref:leucine-rich repeat protein n=2 Tax=uncultured Duncaniella sp. TaxID=2768039 RepID=UPI0025A95B02|nr:leucine-rich repeat protein [uncultured Duncaniella sp.]
MEYPLISEYRDAILSAEDNFNELSSLRPVLDSNGNPVMSSGNFAVVFKMRDEKNGKFYAVQCFIKEQEGRNESYRKIADELEGITSPYVVTMRYIEDELFVDSAQCECEEFPVVLMEWVDGEPLDACLKRKINDRYEVEMLSYRFNQMATWLLTQPFAHGDIKPDNILVREDGTLVLVDYDGMFVPSMKGEKAREIGSPDYRHPLRAEEDFNEHIDDFSISVIALSLKAIALKPELRKNLTADTLLFTERDFRDPSMSDILRGIQTLAADSELSLLLGAFFIALAKNSLDLLSFKTFVTAKPKRPIISEAVKADTSVTAEDIANGVKDEFGVIYSKDGKRLLKSPYGLENYNIKEGTEIICDEAFWFVSLERVEIPTSVTSIGDCAFYGCDSLQSVYIPSSVISIGDKAFMWCLSLQSVEIPSSVTVIGDSAFKWCHSLQSVEIPSSVTVIGDSAFYDCSSLQRVEIPTSVTTIGNRAFLDCRSLRSVNIPTSVTVIGDSAFMWCHSLQSVEIPSSVTSIGENAFYGCRSLERVDIPSSVTSIGDSAFEGCSSLQRAIIHGTQIGNTSRIFPSKCTVIYEP